MMNIKELNKKTKDELVKEVKHQRKRAIILIILIIIIGGYLLWGYIQDGLETKNQFVEELDCQVKFDSYLQNQTNMTTAEFKKEICPETTTTQIIKTFFTEFLNLDYSWIIKLLIFLGIIYLIQVTFALAMDLLEVVMLFFVIIKRIYKWIKSKIKKKDEPNKNRLE